MQTDEKIASESSTEVQEPGIDLESLSAEQYDAWRMDGALPEAKPAESPTATKTIETPDESGKSKGNQEAGKGRPIKHLQDRSGEIEAEIQDFEAKLARRNDLKRQLESEPGAKTESPTVSETKPAELKPPTKPKVDDFKTWDEYEAARDQYAEDNTAFKIAKALQEDRAQRAGEATREKQQAEGRTRAEKWNQELKAAGERHSDWDEKIDSIMDLVKSPGFSAGADFLVDSPETAMEVLYHLGADPDRAQEIAAMSPTKQVAALAVIAHTLTKPAESVKKTPPGPKKVTETPPPPTELAGRNQLPPDPVAAAIEADDTEAYNREMNARDVAALKAGTWRR